MKMPENHYEKVLETTTMYLMPDPPDDPEKPDDPDKPGDGED